MPAWANSGEQFLVHPRRAVGWAGLLIALVLLGAVLIPTGPLALDSRWAELMRDIETPVLTHVALVFNALGRGLWRGLTLAVIGLALLVAGRRTALVAFAVTEAVTPLASNTIKTLVDRPRPPRGLIDAHGSSFPSGHAAYAGATAIALVLLFTRLGARRPLWFLAAGLVIAGMAWSRTYLQVHWLSDATAGALLGIAVTLLSFGCVQISRARTAGQRRSSTADAPRRRSVQD